jgi:hypothetical protein
VVEPTAEQRAAGALAPAEVTCCCSTERAEQSDGCRCQGLRSRLITTRRTAGLATSVKPQPANTCSVPRNASALLFGPAASGNPSTALARFSSAGSTAAVNNAGVRPVR